MTRQWQALTWGDLCTLEYGKSLSSYQQTPALARVFGTNGPIGWHDQALWAGPGVILGRKGAYRGVHFSETSYWVIDTAYSLKPKRDFNLKWAYYVLQHSGLGHMDDGSPIPSTTRNAFYHEPVVLPSRHDQDFIANLLGAIDERIALNEEIAKTLEAAARALFQSWFVDFDPTRRAAAGEDTALPPHIAALFPARFTDDGLPECWVRKELWQMADMQRETVDPASLGDRTVLHFSLPAYDAGRGPVTEKASAIKSNKSLVRRGMVLFSKLNPQTPRVWIVPDESKLDMLASTEFIAVTPVQGIPMSYLWSLFSSPALQGRAAAMVTGTSKSHQRVQPSALFATTWPFPAPPVLAAFDAIVQPTMLRTEALHAESSTLVALRDTLLPKLIFGELRIRQAENIAESA